MFDRVAMPAVNVVPQRQSSTVSMIEMPDSARQHFPKDIFGTG
jgi:hypothetical protein